MRQIDIETVDSLCGCSGKTSLERVVYPARRLISERLEDTGVELAEAREVGLFPRAQEYVRRTSAVEFADPDDDPLPVEMRDEEVWSVTATLAHRSLGKSAERFADVVGDTYDSLSAASSATIGKGHAVQLHGTDDGIQWFEHFRPVGERRTGYTTANVDVVHAFPDLPPEKQARIAAYHSLNDCYSAGASLDRTIRPMVVVPEGVSDALDAETVTGWFESAVADDVDVYPAAVLEHDGVGWLFGAVATAAMDHAGPFAVDGIEPGDRAMIHRPCGGLSLFSLAVDDASERRAREDALELLTRDHREVAEVIASYCPGPDESFDPDEHLKAASDVSGPGIRGLGDFAERAGLTFRLSSLPLADEAAIGRARDRWIMEDATVETNGPVAVVGSPSVVADLRDDLRSIDGADPHLVGEFVPDGGEPFSTTESLDAMRYIEGLA